MKFGSLFAGVGGMDLGLERAGMTCDWQVEIDPYAQAVLAKHWPKVARYEDVREVHGRGGCGRLHQHCGDRRTHLRSVDLICGGFPCQGVSNAGLGAGLDDERSGLWSEQVRLVRELRPRYVLLENVAALLVRGLGRVLGDLAACGYDAEWDCIPASALGAHHQRDRLFVIAYATGQPDHLPPGAREDLPAPPCSSGAWEPPRPQDWPPLTDLGRSADGLPSRVDRLRCLGNAVVPAVAEFIGRRIMSHATQTRQEQ